MATVYTPLRYPGGKSQIAPYFKTLFDRNKLGDSHYVEPYAGGAGVALALLMTEYAKHIHLNDIYYPIYSFWHTLLNQTDVFCNRISTVNIDMDVWREQKSILKDQDNHTIEEVGFAFFFLNRANRSGIINGGVIGGNDQTGNYKIDARFNRKDLIARAEAIARYRHRISLYNLDAEKFLKKTLPKLPKKTIVYLDPPYYCKGSDLYHNSYKPADHQRISTLVQEQIRHKWIVTYDNHPVINNLYEARRKRVFSLNYSAAHYQKGKELMIYSDSLEFVDINVQDSLPFD
jgi:DNA adenine methylase